MKHCILYLCVLLISPVHAQPNRAGTSVGSATFSVSFPAAQSGQPLDGRILLILAKTDKTEPRQQVSDAVETAQLFGVDVNALRPGQAAVVDASAFGYPKRS